MDVFASSSYRQRRAVLLASVAALLAVLSLILAPSSAQAAPDEGGPSIVMDLFRGDAVTGFEETEGLEFGDTVTVEFKDGEAPVHDNFDFWLCPDTTVYPDDNRTGVDVALNGDCVFYGLVDRTNGSPVDAVAVSWVFSAEESPITAARGTEEEGGDVVEVELALEESDFEPFDELEDLCASSEWYLLVHDNQADRGDAPALQYSNFLGPFIPTGCIDRSGTVSAPTAPTAPLPPVLTCSPDPVAPGGTVTCEVTRGDADIDILWRAAFGEDVFASTGVRLGADGTGSFSFVAPRAAACESVSVELVEWIAPIMVGVDCAVTPSGIPAGEGPVPMPLALLLAALVSVGGASLLGRRVLAVD